MKKVPVSPRCLLSFSPRTIKLAPHHLNAALCYLNAWNRLIYCNIILTKSPLSRGEGDIKITRWEPRKRDRDRLIQVSFTVIN